jgi:hypothetical protein
MSDENQQGENGETEDNHGYLSGPDITGTIAGAMKLAQKNKIVNLTIVMVTEAGTGMSQTANGVGLLTLSGALQLENTVLLQRLSEAIITQEVAIATDNEGGGIIQ